MRRAAHNHHRQVNPRPLSPNLRGTPRANKVREYMYMYIYITMKY